MRNRKAVGWGELIVGVLLIILGIYTFIRPAAALEGATLIYGIFALVTGIMDIVYYVKLEQRTGFAPTISLISGIISVIAITSILRILLEVLKQINSHIYSKIDRRSSDRFTQRRAGGILL